MKKLFNILHSHAVMPEAHKLGMQHMDCKNMQYLVWAKSKTGHLWLLVHVG